MSHVKAVVWLVIAGFLGSLTAHAANDPPLILSKVTFNESSSDPIIDFATIATPDQLRSCPLQTLAPDLRVAISEVVNQVRTSLAKVKATQTQNCQQFTDRMNEAQTQVQTALINQFQASASTDANQAKINAQIQQANAVNLLLMTTTNLVQNQCIDAIDERIVVQKLIGQMITLTGLIMGGWQGIGISAGGQMFSSLPLFRSEIDKALVVFQKNDEIHERGTFLCLFREMQKKSCLLYAEGGDKIINGLDMTFDTGPARTTIESIHQIEEAQPELLHDVKKLRTAKYSSAALTDTLRRLDSSDLNSLDSAFTQVRLWCRQQTPAPLELPRLGLDSCELPKEPDPFLGPKKLAEYEVPTLSPFLSPDTHPVAIQEALRSLMTICPSITDYSYTKSTKDQRSQILTSVFESLKLLQHYYEELAFQKDNSAGKIAATFESMVYFINLKKAFQLYIDPSSGNHERGEYFRLAKRLEETFSRDSFKTLFKEEYQTFMETKHSWLTNHLSISWIKPIQSERVRKKALTAMLSICQTIDPTLACLYAGNPEQSPLFHSWKKRCVGPKSPLCKYTLEHNEAETLLGRGTTNFEYFNSLCGVSDS